MATDAQTTANIANAQASTGPRTSSGKDTSSRNAIRLGLFTLHDFVRPGEHDEYSHLVSGLKADLNPEGALEETLAAAIIGAAWRLRRCSLAEARMAETCELDPMEDDSAGRTQTSVDRSRAHAHKLLRGSIAELRRLQTERAIRFDIFDLDETPTPDLASYAAVRAVADNHDRAELLARKLDSAEALAGIAGAGLGNGGGLESDPPQPVKAPTAAAVGSFCKTADHPAGTPRNAPCPCGSGLKHKHCCAKSAPVALHLAA